MSTVSCVETADSRTCYFAAMGVGAKIRARREELQLSQADLAARIGIKQQSLDAIEKDRTKKSRYLPEIAEVLGLQMADLDASFARRGKGRFTTELPLAGDRDLPVFASAEGGAGSIILSSDPVDFVRRPAPLAQVKDGYGLIVVGESMIPAYEPGDTLLVHPHLPPLPGCDVVLYAESGGGEVLVTVKRLRRLTAGSWLLTQFNPPAGAKADFVLSRKEWQKCHRVVGKYSRR